MKKTVLSALAVVALLLAPKLAPAQEGAAADSKTLVTVAFSGYGELLADIEFIGAVSGNPQLKEMVEGALQQSPAGPALAGLDTTRPWGFVVQGGADEFPMFGFIPVTDLGKMLSAAEPMIGKPTLAGDGVLEIVADDQSFYLKEKEGGWAFFARTPDALADTPADPTQALGGLHERYDLAVQVNVANVPPMLRQMAMAPIQMGMQVGMRRLPDETDEQYALRQKAAQQGMQQFQQMLDELDTLIVGFSIDRTASTASLEYEITALEGTKAAEQMAQTTEGPSDFAGFVLPEAAVTLNAVSKISQSDVDRAKTSLAPIRGNAVKELQKQGLAGAELQRAEKLVNDLFAVLDTMLESGKVDVGLSLVLDPDALTYVSGMKVGDTTRLDSLVKELTNQLIREQPDLAGVIKLDAAEHEGVRFHVVSVPTAGMAADLPNLPQLVGPSLDVVVGIGAENAYLAAGRNALDTLKQAIDQSKAQAGQTVLPVRLTLSATPIAKFAALVARDEQVKGIATMVGHMLEQAGEKDHLTMTSTPIPRGVKVRVELEEGLLKVIGSAPMMMGGPGAER